MEKNVEYLRLLQERNKLKKIMLTKTKDEIIKDELERGFKTQFRGANASKDCEKTPPAVKINSKPSSAINKIILDANKIWGKHQQAAKDDCNQSNFNKSFHNIVGNEVIKEEESSDYEPDFDEPSDIDENKFNANLMVSGSWNEEDEKNIQLYINELKHNKEIISQTQPSIIVGEEMTENSIGEPKTLLSGSTTLHQCNIDISSPIVNETKFLENDNIELDYSLQNRVKFLSVEQKRKLLQLLKAEESSPELISSNEIRSGTTKPNSNFEIENRNRSQNINSSPISNAPIALECESKDKKTIEQFDSILGCSPNIDSSISTQLLLIRIKILTQWTKSKFISLKAIRLRGISSIEGQKYVDLLQYFKVKVNSGMVSISSNSETVRNLNLLTSGSNKPSLLMHSLDAKSYYPVNKTSDMNNLYWKAPFTLDKPIELIFEADLEKISLCSKQPYQQVVLENLSLLLWNNEFQKENCSAAKDVDIYIGSLCIWSGQLEEEEQQRFQETPSTIKSSNQLIIHNEIPPTLTISPLTVSTKINENFKANESMKNISNQTIKNVDPVTEELTSEVDISFKQEGTKPNWLIEESPYLVPHGLQNNLEHVVISNPNFAPKSASRRSRNRDDNPGVMKDKLQLNTAIPPSNTLAIADNIISTSKHKPFSRLELLSNEKNNIPITPTKSENTGLFFVANRSTDNKQRSLRRNRSHLLDEVNQHGSPSKVILNGDISFSDKINHFQIEEELENSLDAISFAQKFDLGRITNLLKKSSDDVGLMMNTKEVEEEEKDFCKLTIPPISNGAQLRVSKDSNAEKDSLDDRNQQDDDEDVFEVVHNHHLVQSPNKNKNAASMLSVNDLAYKSPSKQSSRVTMDRSARIDLVQEKITSTLAGLAHIISSIPTSTAAAFKSSDDKPHTNNLVGETNSLTMPFGNILTIDVLSTWGDENYVGLNGLEFYDELGRIVVANLKSDTVDHYKPSENASIISISAYPSGLGEVSGKRTKDPRKISNVLDGVNFTRNDLHVWLAPQIKVITDPATDVQHNNALVANIKVVFNKEIHISMIRIFNYNKSRTHSQRGVRKCKISMNEKIIFEGEIKRSSGHLLSEETEHHLIAFTSDTKLLSCVLQDEKYIDTENEVDLEESWLNHSLGSRPKTSQGVPPSAKNINPVLDQYSIQNVSSINIDENAPVKNELQRPLGLELSSNTVPNNIPIHKSTGKEKANHVTPYFEDYLISMKCSKLRFEIESTWGDLSYVGLCGIEVLLSPDKSILKISESQLDAHPRDLSEIGFFDDPRVLKNIINGTNNTAKDNNMWLIPFTKNSKHFITIDLKKEVEILGFRFWNYNKSSEDVLRGCKQMLICVDDKPVFRCLLRQGPGCDGVSFGQTILFRDIVAILEGNNKSQSAAANITSEFNGDRNARLRGVYISPTVRQDYETMVYPSGLLWKFTFFNNWNDGYYLGLDCIEMFDKDGKIIDMSYLAAQISAVPYALDDLDPSVTNDPRKPQNLFDYGNKACSWLCPLSRCMTAQERANCVQRIEIGDLSHKTSVTEATKDSDYSFPQNNVLFIMFQHPISVSAVKFYNYSKTPSRGVKDYMIEVDGRILYMGSLKKFEDEVSNLLYEKTKVNTIETVIRQHKTKGQSVLFSNDIKILQNHKETISCCGSTEQDVLCINERQIMVRSKTMYDQEPANIFLEGIHSDLNKRPVTAYIP